MVTDHLRREIDRLTALPPEQQEAAATQIELYLNEIMDPKECERIAAQLADPHETDLEYLLEEARREIAAGEVQNLDDML